MAELDQWTRAHDDAVRGALGLLRRDVESLPLADVRFVKARGVARHRRALVVRVASAAAAVAAIGFVASNTLGSNQGLDLRPAAPNATSTTATSPAVPLAAPGPLLVAAEWQRALGMAEPVRALPMRSGEGVSTCVRAPGALLAIGFATTASSGFYGVQGTYRAASPEAGNAATATAVSQLLGCQSERYKAEADAAWPKVLSSATADGKSWFIVAHQGALTSLLSLGDPILGNSTAATPHFSLAQIQALALVAQQRLVREVEGASQPSVSTTRTDPGLATTQTAR